MTEAADGGDRDVPASWPTEESLYEQYYAEARSIRETADHLDATYNQVLSALDAYDIPAGLQKNVRYLLANPPATLDELPNGAVHPEDRQLGVRSMYCRGVADGAGCAKSVYYHAEVHDPREALHRFLAVNDIDPDRSPESIVQTLRRLPDVTAGMAVDVFDEYRRRTHE